MAQNNYPHSTKVRFPEDIYEKLRQLKYETRQSGNQIINALLHQVNIKDVETALSAWKKKS